MEKVARIMYTIGKVFNIISIVFITLAVIAAAVGVANPDQIFQQLQEQGDTTFVSAADLRNKSLAVLIGLGIYLLISIAILILAIRASRAVKNGEQTDVPHIIMVIIGVFGDIFYLLGGVFGLIANSQQRTIQQITQQNKKSTKEK